MIKTYRFKEYDHVRYEVIEWDGKEDTAIEVRKWVNEAGREMWVTWAGRLIIETELGPVEVCPGMCVARKQGKKDVFTLPKQLIEDVFTEVR